VFVFEETFLFERIVANIDEHFLVVVPVEYL
jgi:hypothetical protein